MEKTKPTPPAPPLSRVMREGEIILCDNCHSTMTKDGFLRLFGTRYCDNKECPNSKNFKKKPMEKERTVIIMKMSE